MGNPVHLIWKTRDYRVKRADISDLWIITWGSFECLVFKDNLRVISGPDIKMASNTKTADRTEKLIAIWYLGVLVEYIWGTFDLVVLKILLTLYTVLDQFGIREKYQDALDTSVQDRWGGGRVSRWPQTTGP